MSIKVFKDSSANSIFIEDANGAQFLNSLQASVPVDKIVITDLAKQIEIVSNEAHTEFVDENGNQYTGTALDVCNELNAIFQTAGTPTQEVPSITSALTINSVQGSIVNYELTADYGVGYEWDLSTVSGLTTVDGNVRKLIGGASLATGTYSIPVKAINYNGADTKTIILNVSTPPFANTKSIQFNNQDYLGANASLLDGVLGRTGNGAGSSDAWSMSFWLKPTNSSSGRVLVYFGSNDTANSGFIEVRLTSTNKLRLQYGSSNNYLRVQSTTVLSVGTWQHITICYDGGTTGASSADISNYYGRFNMFIDGVSETTNNSHNNYGWSSAISGQNFRVGKLVSGNTLNGEKIDELAIWDTDQSANISDIYNSGVPFDLSTLTTAPTHWWRMGDGDTFPDLQDSGTAANCVFVMYNMTAGDIVNDVP
tara:strand:- start:260 stop:1534 length:1275 start_codon:yes stop_codon:yes gene_type:complete